MRKLIVTALVAVGLFAGTVGFAPAAQASRVRCFIPTAYKVTCYNATPYRVFVNLKIYTTNGTYFRYVKIAYSKRSVYVSAPINRITWRWHY